MLTSHKGASPQTKAFEVATEGQQIDLPCPTPIRSVLRRPDSVDRLNHPSGHRLREEIVSLLVVVTEVIGVEGLADTREELCAVVKRTVG